MKTWSMLSVLALVFCFTFAWAEDKKEEKEVTLKGKICCCKCELKKAKTCATAIVVKDGEKEVVYVFDADSNKKHHKAICTEPKMGTVKGTVKKDGEKLIITVSDLKFAD